MLLLILEGACYKYRDYNIKRRVSLRLDTSKLLNRKERTALYAYRSFIVLGVVLVSDLKA
jgi:hypothetical protein